MKRITQKQVIEIIGLVGVVASLIFVGLQLRQNAKIAYSELDASLLAMRIECSAQINQYSEIWLRGCQEDSLGHNEKIIFKNLVRNLNDIQWIEYRHLKGLGKEDFAIDIVHDWAALLFANPGARSAWQQRELELNAYRKILIEEGHDYTFWLDIINKDIEKLKKEFKIKKGMP